jgi:hypothetical protein
MDLSAAFLGLLQRSLNTMESLIATRADGASWTPALAAKLQTHYVPHPRVEIPGAATGTWTVPAGVSIIWLSMVGQGGSGIGGARAGLLYRFPILTEPGATFDYVVPGRSVLTTGDGGPTYFGDYGIDGGADSDSQLLKGEPLKLTKTIPPAFIVEGTSGQSSGDEWIRGTPFGLGGTATEPAGYGGGGGAAPNNYGGPGLIVIEY